MNKKRLLAINQELQSYYRKIKLLTDEVVQDIIGQIKTEFPSMMVVIEGGKGEGDDTWIKVDKGSYEDEKFLELLTRIDTETLFESGVYSVYIVENIKETK